MASSELHINWYRFRLLFFILAVCHVFLVFFKSHIFGYNLSYDAVKYLHVANEFLGRAPLDYQYNCNTSPGYPLFLAPLIFLFPDSVMAVMIAQVLIFSFSLYVMMSTLISKKFLTTSQAVIASAMVMLSLDFITYNGYVLTESLTASLLMLIVSLLLKDRDEKINMWLLSFLPVALIAVRTEYIILFPAFLLAVYLNRFTWKRILLPVVLLSFMLTANGIRNMDIYGKFSFFGFGGSQVTYGGNNLNGDGSWHYYATTPDYLPEHGEREMMAIDMIGDECIACPKRDSLFKVLVREAIRENGVSNLSLVPVKLAKMWTLPGEIDPYTSDSTFSPAIIPEHYFKSSESVVSNIMSNKYIIYHWLFLGLSLAGLVIRWWKYKAHYFDFTAMAIVVAVSMAYAVLFYGLPRFHIPLLPFVLVYTAFLIGMVPFSVRK